MSDKYVIDKSKRLGHGGTADVFLGLCLENGCQYALKCSKEKLEQEVSTMKSLSHKNIIKFFDNFINFQGFTEVIVMEYCNMGSLYEFIELHRGLCDNMFLTVLECLNDGMKYLRENKIIHRDIKPGNMMVHQDDMGYYHAKLGDMGSAKRVDDDQRFMSLVGTEEYLHPDMYISYLEKIQGNFGNKVDLWSMGVTLYHAAVTQLPFKPYQYSRKSKSSKRILRKMYTDKKTGIISGKQNSEREDDITWSDKLPDHCRLSAMLKDLASKLIGHLMDLDESNSFERFFKEAKDILQKKRVLVFNSLNGELQIIYLNHTTYTDVLDQISKTVKLPKEEILILTKNKRLEPFSDQNIQCFRSLLVRGHLRYTLTDDTALVLTTKSMEQSLPIVSPQLSKTTFNKPSVNLRETEQIKTYIYDVMKALYDVNYSTNYIDCQIECYIATAYSFNEHVLKQNLLLINEALPWQMKAIRDLCTMADSLINFVTEVIKDKDNYTNAVYSLSKCKEEIEQLRKKGMEGEKCAEQYNSSIIVKQQMLKFTEKHCNYKHDDASSDNLDFLVHLAEELANELKLMSLENFVESDNAFQLEIWQRLVNLWKYFEASKKQSSVKSKCIHSMQFLFNKWLNQGLSIKDRVDILGEFLCGLDKRRVVLKSKFLQISDFLLRVLGPSDLEDNIQFGSTVNIDESNILKYRIMELKELTEKMKNKFCIEKQ